jgi:hypothetical protein
MTHTTRADRRHLLQTAALAVTIVAASSAVGTAWAQAAKWPSKPIRIVVAFPPGGLTDAYARNYGEYLSTKLGVPVVIDNKPGAGAIIGIDAVAKAPADGYTLSMSTSGTHWQNRILYSKLPYNLDKDLAKKLTMEGFSKDLLKSLTKPTTEDLSKFAMGLCDAVAKGSPKLSRTMENAFKATEKRVLAYAPDEERVGAHADFYHDVLEEALV